MIVSSTSNGKPALNGVLFNHGTTGVRQTVQSALVDANGYANFLGTSASLAMPISATATNITIHASGGSLDNDRWGKVVTDATLTLGASLTSYIMATIDSVGAITFSSVTLAPIYQFGGTPSVTNNQYTFNISKMKMYLGNGSTASQVWAVCVGEAITSGTAVTSVVNYALNGMYDSGRFAITANIAYSKNHNLGVVPSMVKTLQATSTNGALAEPNQFNEITAYRGSPIISIINKSFVLSCQASLPISTGAGSQSQAVEAVMYAQRGW